MRCGSTCALFKAGPRRPLVLLGSPVGLRATGEDPSVTIGPDLSAPRSRSDEFMYMWTSSQQSPGPEQDEGMEARMMSISGASAPPYMLELMTGRPAEAHVGTTFKFVLPSLRPTTHG